MSADLPSPPGRRRAPGTEPPHGTTNRYQWRKSPCRCPECRAAVADYARARDHRARSTPAESKTGLWVDWSGFTAVWVCECGEQGFGGMSTIDGYRAAQKHWSAAHPDREAIAPYVDKGACGWGATQWGEIRGETCDRPAEAGTFCKTHYTRNSDYTKMGGFCVLEDCLYVKAPDSDYCKTHRNRRIRLDREAEIRARNTRTDVEHGTRGGYKKGCRCKPCCAAQSAYASEARARRLQKEAS